MQNQSKKQNSLSAYINNQQELEIIEAVENSIQLGRTDNPSESALAIAAKWRMYIGIPKQDATEELMIISSYLVETYPFLTIGEFELAIKLSMQSKLKDCEFYGFFSPLYVSKVIESYLYYRKIQTADVVRRKEKHDSELRDKANKPSPELQCERIKEIIQGHYDHINSNKDINDYGNYMYDFIRKRKWLYMNKEKEEIPKDVPPEMCILLTKESIAEAQAYGKKKTIDFISKLKRKSDFDRDFLERKYAREYCVEKYFKNVDIVMLLNNIKLDYFS